MMRKSIILQGTFVDLRPLEVADAELTLVWRQSVRARLLNPGANSVEEQVAWIEARPASEFNFMIELKSGRAVGMLSLIGLNKLSRHAEAARFLIGDEGAVKGIPAAVEAMRLLYAFAFDSLGLRRVFGNVTSDNVLMLKWQKYLGMREEGRMREHHFLAGKFQDAVIVGMLEEEFRIDAMPRMDALIAMADRAVP